jgi:hypothetical protein
LGVHVTLLVLGVVWLGKGAAPDPGAVTSFGQGPAKLDDAHINLLTSVATLGTVAPYWAYGVAEPLGHPRERQDSG